MTKMKTFHVYVREVHIQTVEVEAEDSEGAIESVANGEGNYLCGGLEYSHVLEDETWTVEEKT